MSELPPTSNDSMKKAILRSMRAVLLELGSATKVELSRKLGLSFPTVSKFLAQMERDGEIYSSGLDNSNGGRRAARYVYDPDYLLGLALFLEKAETNYTVFNGSGAIKEQGTVPGVLLDPVLCLSEQVERILAKYPRIGSIAVGVPGAVNNGRIIYIPGYEQFHHFDLKSDLEERFSIPVAVENDMNAAILGYSLNAAETENPTLIYLYFGQNGPGAGILVNGDVVRGSTFFSGEISFVPQYDDRNFLQALGREAGVEITAREKEIDAVSRLVASFTAILNPHAIIFCDDEVSGPLLDGITRRSAAYIPEEHLPELTSSDWKRDYLSGLQSLGLDLMIREKG
ncbi:ROK family protein [Paenibacillus sp. 1P03SA]|uniref:ROK family transcriptional regulator n=1 Tax=Paenibacillus sp. 1P03SA TaxID=3132294 RepID=UPI00399FDCF3